MYFQNPKYSVNVIVAFHTACCNHGNTKTNIWVTNLHRITIDDL